MVCVTLATSPGHVQPPSEIMWPQNPWAASAHCSMRRGKKEEEEKKKAASAAKPKPTFFLLHYFSCIIF